MIINSALKVLFSCVSSVYKSVDDTLNNFKGSWDENTRYQHLMDAVKFLDKSGGFEINVDSTQGSDGYRNDTEVHVSIVYKVYPHQNSENWIELHTSYCVDFSSWKSLANDLRILEHKYLDISQRIHKGLNDDYFEFDKEFSKLMLYANNQANLSKKQVSKEPR